MRVTKAKPSRLRGAILLPAGKRFVIGQPGHSVEPTYLDQYAQWEVIDRNHQSRVCLTQRKETAVTIADALEVFHVPGAVRAGNLQKKTKGAKV